MWRQAAWAALVAFGVFLGGVALRDKTGLFSERPTPAPAVTKSLFVRLSHEVGKPNEAINPKMMTNFGSLDRSPLFGCYLKKLISDVNYHIAIIGPDHFANRTGNDGRVLRDFRKTRTDKLLDAVFSDGSVRLANIVGLDSDLKPVGQRAATELVFKGLPISMRLPGHIHAHGMDNEAGQLQSYCCLGAQFTRVSSDFRNSEREPQENSLNADGKELEERYAYAYDGENERVSVEFILGRTFIGLLLGLGLSVVGWHDLYNQRRLRGATLLCCGWLLGGITLFSILAWIP